jgi:hypothetical protein
MLLVTRAPWGLLDGDWLAVHRAPPERTDFFHQSRFVWLAIPCHATAPRSRNARRKSADRTGRTSLFMSKIFGMNHTQSLFSPNCTFTDRWCSYRSAVEMT